MEVKKVGEKALLAVEAQNVERKVDASKTKHVLDEETYTQNVESIIVRDFYPDLPKLQAQSEYLDALSQNDVAKLRQIHIKYGPKPGTLSTPSIYSTPATFETPENQPQQTPKTSGITTSETSATQAKDNEKAEDDDGPTHNPEPTSKEEKGGSALSLDRFLAKNTSEDNEAFVEIMKDIDQKQKQKHEWLYEKEKEQEKEHEEYAALPSVEQQAIADTPANLQTWQYSAKNSLMYVPDGVEHSAVEKIKIAEGKQREILHQNTRFQTNPFNLRKSAETIQEAANAQAANLYGKVGPDGKEVLPTQTPRVNGYGFVATPSPAPGVDASPLMTWGEIEGTPFRLDGSDTPLVHNTPGPVFKMPDVPKRDRLALELSEKASKAHRAKKEKALKRVTANFSSPSPKFGSASKTERLSFMSPAAQRLATAKLGIRTNTDKALRASYTPSPSRSISGDKTPLSLTPGSSRRTPKRGVSTPKSTSVTPKRDVGESLTDNLLQLPKRPKAHDFF